MNLLGFESYKCLFCDVNWCFVVAFVVVVFFIKGNIFVAHLCPCVLLLIPFPFQFSKVVCPETKIKVIH